MRKIKDARGELLRLRIFLHNLFDLRERIISSSEFKSLNINEWDRDGVRALIEKGVTDWDFMVGTPNMPLKWTKSPLLWAVVELCLTGDFAG